MDWRVTVKDILDLLGDFHEYLVTSYIGGIIIILIGLWAIYYTIQNPQPSDSIFWDDINALLGGIICILMGFAIIILKLMGKL